MPGREVDHRAVGSEGDEVAAVRDLVRGQVDPHRRGFDRAPGRCGTRAGRSRGSRGCPTSLPGGSPPGITFARPTSLRRGKRVEVRQRGGLERRAAAELRRPARRHSRRERAPRISRGEAYATIVRAARLDTVGRCRRRLVQSARRRSVRRRLLVAGCSERRRLEQRRRPPPRRAGRPPRRAGPRRRPPRPTSPRSTSSSPQIAELERPIAMTVRAGDDDALRHREGRAAPRHPRRPARSDAGARHQLDGRTASGNEQGLLGLAFSPDGTKLYVHYSQPQRRHPRRRVRGRRRRRGGHRRRAARCSRSDQPQSNHNGGELAFGPDGLLYLGLGDGGSAGDQGRGHASGGNGQSLGTLLGKILRIDPTPSARTAVHDPARQPVRRHQPARAPRSGPTGCATRGASRSTRTTGDLWIGDVGQNAWEEVDFATKAVRRREGRQLRMERLGGDAQLPRRRRAGRGSAGLRVLARRRELLGDRRLRVPRHEDPGNARRLPLRGLLRRRAARARRAGRQGRPGPRCSRCGSRRSRASARTTTASSTCSRTAATVSRVDPA